MAYYTLVAALPNLPPYFDVERPPITRLRLNELLEQLSQEDATVLRQLRDFLAWDRQPSGRSDQQVVEHYERLQRELRHPLVLEVVEQRINVRTIVSALRRKKTNEGPPIGVGGLVEPIRRAWNEPHFGLQRRFPWIEDFEQHMLAGNAIQAERTLFDYTWKTFSRMATEFTFSFEAVLLYLARWAIIERWTSRDVQVGRERFEQLIEETLGEHSQLRY